MRALLFIRKKLVWFIPFAMLLGLTAGYFLNVSVLKSLILPLTILMIYPMMVTLNFRSIFSGCNYRLEAVTQSINFVAIPLVAFLLGKLFFPQQPLTALGLFLIALLPTSGMTISWTGFAKGNVQVAIKMTLIGLVLGALATPLYITLFMGANVSISAGKTLQQILIVVFSPMLLGYITQTLLLKRYGQDFFKEKIKPVFPSVATLAVLGIIFTAMALKAKAIIQNPETILRMILPLILFYAVNFLISTLIGKWLFKREEAIALVYGSVMRNLSVALAIAMVAFGQEGLEIALIIAVAYVIQVQSAAAYLQLVDRFFGKVNLSKNGN
ncbi:MAG: arsenic resistance protein [Anaerolineaceae bacterium]|nr:arsenic resistance protein [Anaerolineaceae bacterium]